MENAFGTLFIILVSCLATVIVFRYLNINSIVGYLVSGLLIGPHAAGLVTNVDQIKLIGEFGVLFLLFSIGLKMPIKRLHLLKKYVFGLGVAQVIITVGISFLICIGVGYLTKEFHCSPVKSLFIGSAFTLSSTAVGLYLLTEKGDMIKQHGHASFSILLLQDLFVVLLLVLISTIGTGVSFYTSLSIAFLKFIMVLSLIVLCSQFLLRPIFRLISSLHNSEIFTAFSILIVLATSFVTEKVGLSKELGAFVAGFLLSGTEYRHQIEADIQPFYGLLLGVFFVSIGMAIDVHFIVTHYQLIILLLTLMILIKSGIIFVLCKVFNLSNISALHTACLLAAGGEFAFVILKPLVEKKIVANDEASIIYLVIAISMALTPFLASLGKWIAEIFELKEEEQSIAEKSNYTEKLNNHVILAGFGRSGKALCHLLAERMIPFVAIDKDMNRVLEGRGKGMPVYYGNANRDSVWESINADKCIVALVSLSPPKDTVRAALMLRRKFNKMKVCARIYDKHYSEKLQKAGCVVIKPEIYEPSLQTVKEILSCYKLSENESKQILEKFRRLCLVDFNENLH